MTLRQRVLGATNAALADEVIAAAKRELAVELAALDAFSWADEHTRHAAVMRRIREVIE